MKFFSSLILLILLHNCSFDNKTGIWKNENVISQKENKNFKDFKSINITNKDPQKIIPIDKNFNFKKLTLSNSLNWQEEIYNQGNNLKNFSFQENFKLISKSGRLTRHDINDGILLINNNLILTDKKGNIIIYSTISNKIISKYNFYKKKYKNVKIKINIIVEKDLIYASDNLGYLYAYNYKNNKILWAKKYNVAFRSNIKIYKDKIITSNLNNILYFFNKKNGDILTSIPTEETLVKNKFENNISSNNNLSFFINTFGSLYAVDNINMRVIWFINLSQSIDTSQNNSFFGRKLVNDKQMLVASNKNFTYIIDQKSGTVLFKKSFSSSVHPIIIDDYLFTITDGDFLTATNMTSGKQIYSYDLNNKIAKFLDTKKKKAYFKNLMILNSKIVIFLKNSYILVFKINGDLEQIRKLPTKILSSTIIIDNKILYIDKKNRVSIIN